MTPSRLSTTRFIGLLCLAAAGSPLFAQDRFMPPPAVLQSPLDNPATVIKRLSDGSEGKTITEKKLQEGWIKSLALRGEPTVHTAANSQNFAFIGMPVSGIGSGQIYLSGDGKLWDWDIFNTRTADFFQMEQGEAYKKPHTPGNPADPRQYVLEQGFILQTTAGGKTSTRTLDKSGFSDIKFRGQYPIGYVDYADPACPVQVNLEAFSPFVPGNVADSSYPATILNYTITNTSKQPVDCVIGGWLENAVAWKSRGDFQVQLKNTITKAKGYSILNCSADPALKSPRPPIVFDDFESGTFDKWTVEGAAFSPRPIEPSEGRRIKDEADTRPVGQQGKYYADSFQGGGDDTLGKLISKPFVIDRSYITFLIGGGGAVGLECINLVVDGTTARSTPGRCTPVLRPAFWDVRDLAGKTAHLEILDQAPRGWAFVMIDNIVFADTPGLLAERPDSGNMSLALLGAPASIDGAASIPIQKTSDSALTAPATESAQSAEAEKNPKLVGSLRRKVSLMPGQKATVSFVVSWYFPNPLGFAISTPSNRQYASRFKSSQDVTEHLVTNMDRLTGVTRSWHNTWYDSTLPYWFLDRTFANTSILATTTGFLLTDNRFYANEGRYSCPGTCTHVWSYQQAIGYLFPELERRLRQQVDFGPAMNSKGAVGNRGEGCAPAVDGQSGIILRAYLAHRMSADNSFLKQNYAGVQKAMDFLINQFDADRDGIMEGAQDNTLDSAWFGKNAWLSLYYQAALRATAEMADAMSDPNYAKQLRTMADQGRTYIENNLFNGEYFIQEPDPKKPESPGIFTGCHLDQLMGQAWAYHVGLGSIIDPAKATTALNSIWKYNYTTDVGPFREAFKEGRWYAMAGEGGLLMGTFPRGNSEGPLKYGYGVYFNEVWSGSEHLAASLMMWQGMVDKALAEERTIHDRHDAAKRNPWNELECGSHYSRAMSSYGVFTAACGFDYDGPNGVLSFSPRLTPDNFRGAFTAAEGWGTFTQKREAKGGFMGSIDLRYGKLRLKTFALTLPAGQTQFRPEISVNGKLIPAKCSVPNGKLIVRFTSDLVLTAGQNLTVRLR